MSRPPKEGSGARPQSAPDRRFDALGWAVLGVALVLVFATFRQYGVAWDEQGETVYGALLLKYYASGFHDRSAFEFVNFRYYGGGFELPAALLARVSPFSEYETRHLFSALLGIVGLAATWRIARMLGGARAGVLALSLLALNPSWYGHAFINARDIPFGAGMALCLLLALHAQAELPRVRLRTSALFGLTLGLTMSVRVGGVLALAFLAAPIALWLIERARAGVPRGALAREAVRCAGSLLPVPLFAYAMIAVFWPWAIESPLNPWRALTMFARFPYDGLVLFDGKTVSALALPATYLPGLIAVTQPELLLVGVAGAVLLGSLALPRLRAPLGLGDLRSVTVLVAAVLPILYFVIARPVAYNGMRHFLFVIPPLSVLAALAFERALQRAPWQSLRVALALGLVLVGALQVRTLIALHPNQYVYFNTLVGGPRGAQGRYELDYWGTSLAEATQRLARDLERRGQLPKPGQPPIKVWVCGNVWSAATFFPPGLQPASLEEADYQIAIAQFYCKNPPGSRRLLDVKRDGAVLSFVDDLRPEARSNLSAHALVPHSRPH